MVEDDPPGAVIAGAPAVAFVDDDKVKEIPWVGLEDPLAPLVLGERLVEGEVDLAALYDLARFDLQARITEDRKDAILGLIDEDVAVSEVENAGPAMIAGAIPA